MSRLDATRTFDSVGGRVRHYGLNGAIVRKIGVEMGKLWPMFKGNKGVSDRGKVRRGQHSHITHRACVP